MFQFHFKHFLGSKHFSVDVSHCISIISAENRALRASQEHFFVEAFIKKYFFLTLVEPNVECLMVERL